MSVTVPVILSLLILGWLFAANMLRRGRAVRRRTPRGLRPTL